MKFLSRYHKYFLVILIMMLRINSHAQQSYTHTVTAQNKSCNATCSVISIPGLDSNNTAIVVITPVQVNGVNMDPHPIGAYYMYQNKWSVVNLDGVAIPTGAKFTVKYFLTPDPEYQFVQRADAQNLQNKNTRSVINNSHLNNNPEAQFEFIESGTGSGSIISEIGVKYDNEAGHWYLYNTNGKALDYSVTCNIVINSKGKTTTPIVAMSQPAPTTTTAMFAGNVRQILMTIEGVQQGKFKGETKIASQLDKSELMSFNFETSLPVDASSGQATGQHANKPITVTKLFGPASLQLYKAFLTNESLSTVTIEFYATESNGILKLVNTIKLTNARLAGFKQNDVINDVELIKKGLLEELKFTYQKIEMKDAGGLIVADDNTIQN